LPEVATYGEAPIEFRKQSTKPLFGLLKALPLAVVLAGRGAISTFGQSSKGPGKGRPIYDPKTEVTVTGVIQEVKLVAGPGRSTGTRLILKTETGLGDIHSRPTWYLTQQKYVPAKGDQIEIAGSKVNFRGAEVLIARQIKKGENPGALRDERGMPLWSQKRAQ